MGTGRGDFAGSSKMAESENFEGSQPERVISRRVVQFPDSHPDPDIKPKRDCLESGIECCRLVIGSMPSVGEGQKRCKRYFDPDPDKKRNFAL